jgi:type IV pilus assembly protein PilW
MKQRRQQGYSLIELLIATSLAVITGMVALQVASSFQLRRVVTSGKNESVVSAAVAVYTLERELRMTGAGLLGSSGLACKAGINLQYTGTLVNDGSPLPLINIIDGGTGPDTIRYVRSDNRSTSSSGAPANIIDTMASADAELHVDRVDGLSTSDLYVAASTDGNKICTLYQLSEAPVNAGTFFKLRHTSGNDFGYNPNAASVFANPMAYEVGDKVINLGPQPFSAFGISCTLAGGSTPQNCDLVRYAYVEGTPGVETASTSGKLVSVASQIVDLQAQYGVAAAGSQSISEWVDATGSTWQTLTTANMSRIKAVRIAIVARGEYDAALVSPEKLVLWDDPAAGQVITATKYERTLSTAERHYRYQVLGTIVPLVNIIRAGL